MTIKRSKPLQYNVGITKKYESALEQIVHKMRKETEKELNDLFGKKSAKSYFKMAQDAKKDRSLSTKAKLALAALLLKFQLLFNGSARRLAKSMVANIEKYASSTIRLSLKDLTGENFNTNPLSKMGVIRSQAIVAENVSLIKSMPQQYFTQVTGEVMRAIATGQNQDLEAAIVKHGNVTVRRAKTIALDQTHKAMQAIAMQKMLDQGIKRFQWVYTFRSKEPRLYHIARDRKVYDFNKPPGGEFPGTPINCKCMMAIVPEWGK